jgi:hypothetical protein
MTEKIESMEIHPMRGHSRGEWYCSLDDVVASEQDAEYWAVFGITHRGNKHCLGEFPTRSAARSAVREPSTPLKRAAPSRRGRRIIQIEVVQDKNDSVMVDVFALCDDGSIWRRGIGTDRASGLLDDRWEQIPLDGMQDITHKAAFGQIIDARN